MTPAERLKAVYHGQKPDYVPFSIYETKVIGRTYEKELIDLDIGMIRRITTTKTVNTSDEVRYESRNEVVNGRRYCYRTIHTPYGDLNSKHEQNEFTEWTLEYPFKDERDYDKLVYVFEHEDVLPNDAERQSDWELDQKNGNVIVRNAVWLEPMQRLISYIMGAETFCYEWMDNRDKVLRLMEPLRWQNRKAYPLVAKGAFDIINFGGNVAPELIGREVFKEHYRAEWNECADVLHPAGKLQGCHLDACNGPIMDLIQESKLDYIEAYDPVMSPSVYEATRLFEGKLLSAIFPSAWQYHDEAQIVRDTINLIEQAKDPAHFILSITEDIPMDRYIPVVRGIMTGIKQFGRVD